MADAAEPGTTPVPIRSVRWASLLPLLLVWLLAAVPVAFWLLFLRDPELAVRAALLGRAWLWRTVIGLGAAALVLLVAWPPAAAAVRLAFARVRRSLTSDRAPLSRAIAELKHFESAARHLEVGRLALLLDETDRAGQHLHRSLELDAGVAAAHHLFGQVLVRAGHYETALLHFVEAERLEPGHAFGDALLLAGRTALRLHQNERAVAMLSEHQVRHGGGRRSHLWLGDALAAAGDAAGARAAWQVAAGPVTQALTAEENWCRALARVRLWRPGGRA